MIKLKQLLLEKTLYHGTIIDNVPSIEKYGLMPTVGKFVKDAYEDDIVGCGGNPEDYLKDLVFATDKEQLDSAVTAITAQVSKKLGKSFHDVTDEDFIKYGALIKVYDGENYFQHRPEGDENYYGQHPHSVEPGNYYSEDYIGADEILTGHNMIRVLRRYGLWPRLYGFTAGNLKWLRTELIRLALKYHKDKPKDTIIKAVMNLKYRDTLIQKINSYRNILHRQTLKENETPDLKSKVKELELTLEKEFPQLEELNLYMRSAGDLYIDSIKVKPEEKHKGIGSQVMKRILKFADDHDLYTTLHMVSERGYKDKLKRFYQQFGFWPNRGRKTMYQFSSPFHLIMIRRPKSKDLLSEENDEWKRDWLERHNAPLDEKGRLVAYHGTTPNNSKLIKQNGFKKGSYFSLRKEYSKNWGIIILKVALPLDAVSFVASDIVSTRPIAWNEVI